MIWRHYQLGTTISKTTESTKLWDSERGIVEIDQNTLVIPIMLEDEERGHIFHGHGKLLLDTIVETEEGAIGKPVEKELNKCFLMLGGLGETSQHLSEANKEDLAEMGYETQQEFLDEAENLIDRFFRNSKTRDRHHFGKHQGYIFAFQNQNDKLDILVAKGPKLVYTSKGLVFVSNQNKVVLKSPEEVICSSNGKSVIINSGKSIIIRK
jgi:hypothetical protein